MDVTGWISGQVFLHSIDEAEVERINAFLSARGIVSQVMTMNEQMMLDPAQPEDSVSNTSYSIVAQLAGFPQVITQVLSDLMQRSHGGGWDLEEIA
jgi:exosome complex RNA-binding protein Rrp42 (RNase PH superfamily)